MLLTAVGFFLLAVSHTGGDRNEILSGEAYRHSGSAFTRKSELNLPRDLIDLNFSYGKRKSFSAAAAERTVLDSQQTVHAIAGELKKRIALPFDIHVIFEECGDPDSSYDEDTHRITICYELIDDYNRLFSRTLKTKTERDVAAKGTLVSIFLHEVAHALIHGWNLPITGREEDAADQFSTLMLINGLPDGEQMALGAARGFKLLADMGKGEEKDYADPHSLDEQRYFNTICLVYGHRPEQNEFLIRNGTLPAHRAFDCEEDYARVKKSWQTLLAPHLIPLTVPISNVDTRKETLSLNENHGDFSGESTLVLSRTQSNRRPKRIPHASDPHRHSG
jgi:Putative metallopeptidase